MSISISSRPSTTQSSRVPKTAVGDGIRSLDGNNVQHLQHYRSRVKALPSVGCDCLPTVTLLCSHPCAVLSPCLVPSSLTLNSPPQDTILTYSSSFPFPRIPFSLTLYIAPEELKPFSFPLHPFPPFLIPCSLALSSATFSFTSPPPFCSPLVLSCHSF